MFRLFLASFECSSILLIHQIRFSNEIQFDACVRVLSWQDIVSAYSLLIRESDEKRK